MSSYKGFVIHFTGVQALSGSVGEFIIYRRGTDEIVGSCRSISEGIAIIDELLSQEKLFALDDKILIEKLEQEYW